MAWWIWVLPLALAALVAFGRLRVGVGLHLPEGGPPAATVTALGLTLRRRLGSRSVQRAAAVFSDPGRLAAGFSEWPVGEWLGFLQANARLFRWMRHGVRMTAASLCARVGTGDAATTGLLLGWGWAGAGLVAALTGVRPRLELQPVYARRVFAVDFRATLVIRLGRLSVFSLRLAWRLLPLLFRRIAWRGRSNISQERREGVIV